MNLKYLDQKKPKYTKMRFFHIPIIWNYYKVSSITAGILLLPIIIWAIIFSILIAGTWGINSAGVMLTNGNNPLAIATLIIAISIWLSFIYLSYRLYFSFIIFIKNYDSEFMDFSAKECIKKSWKLTKGFKKLLKLVWILFTFAIILLPFNLIEDGLNKTYTDVSNYQIFTQVGEADKLRLQEVNPYYYSELSVKYSQITAEDLEKNIQIYYNLIIFFNILLFIFISGLIEMVMVSFYKRVLTNK